MINEMFHCFMYKSNNLDLNVNLSILPPSQGLLPCTSPANTIPTPLLLPLNMIISSHNFCSIDLCCHLCLISSFLMQTSIVTCATFLNILFSVACGLAISFTQHQWLIYNTSSETRLRRNLFCHGAPSTAFWRKHSDASVSTKALLMSVVLTTESWATEVKSCPWPQCDSTSG